MSRADGEIFWLSVDFNLDLAQKKRQQLCNQQELLTESRKSEWYIIARDIRVRCFKALCRDKLISWWKQIYIQINFDDDRQILDTKYIVGVLSSKCAS